MRAFVSPANLGMVGCPAWALGRPRWVGRLRVPWRSIAVAALNGKLFVRHRDPRAPLSTVYKRRAIAAMATLRDLAAIAALFRCSAVSTGATTLTPCSVMALALL